MLRLNDIRRSLENEGHDLTDAVREIVKEIGLVSDRGVPEVLVLFAGGRITPLASTIPITVVIVHGDGTEHHDESDRVTIYPGDSDFEALVALHTTDANETKP